MRLLVSHQFIPIVIESKSISLEQISYERSQGIVATSLSALSSFLDIEKQRPKMNLKKCYQRSVTLKSGPQSLFFHTNVSKLTI